MAKRNRAGRDYYIDPETKQISRDKSNPNRTKWKSNRVTQDELDKMNKLAKKYAGGNTSALPLITNRPKNTFPCSYTCVTVDPYKRGPMSNDNFNHEIYDICIQCGAEYRFVCNCHKTKTKQEKIEIKAAIEELINDEYRD